MQVCGLLPDPQQKSELTIASISLQHTLGEEFSAQDSKWMTGRIETILDSIDSARIERNKIRPEVINL